MFVWTSKNEKKGMTAIILVNWNGADDTLACLQSLLKVEGTFFVVVVDNASEDDSLERINTFVKDNSDQLLIEILALDDNYGFAIGNNKAIAYAMQFNPDSFLLLNNDTEVAPDFLSKLLTFSSEHPKFRVLSPRINYFHDKELIWECGGKISFGRRTHPFANKYGDALSGKTYIPITFISGCALFFYPELLDGNHHLFTQRYFFGEEDFEFSMRMRKQHIPMACVATSQIYHKVGRSRNKMKAIAHVGKFYMYYLNRLITLRTHCSPLYYRFLELLYMPQCFRYFYSINHSTKTSWKMLIRLLKEVRCKYGVDKEDFRRLMVDNSYFENEK